MFIDTTTLRSFSCVAYVLVIINTFPYHVIRNSSEQHHQWQAEKYTKTRKYFLKKETYGDPSTCLCLGKEFLWVEVWRESKERVLRQISGRKKITLTDILLSRCNYSVTTALTLHPVLITLCSEIMSLFFLYNWIYNFSGCKQFLENKDWGNSVLSCISQSDWKHHSRRREVLLLLSWG